MFEGDFPGSPVGKNSLPMQGMWVPSLVGELDPTHMPTEQLRPPTHSRAPVPQLDTLHGQINPDK